MTYREKDALRFAEGSADSPAKPVIITYQDHAMFKGLNPSSVRAAVRQTSGWILEQTDTTITVVHDRAVIAVDGQNDTTRSCGFVLLRSAIVKIEEIGPHG